MGKVFLDGHLQVPPEGIEAVLAALPEHTRLTRAEPGCLHFEVRQSSQDPTRFLVSEIFVDEDAFDAHQQRARASDWAKVTAGMPRHYNIRCSDNGNATG